MDSSDHYRKKNLSIRGTIRCLAALAVVTAAGGSARAQTLAVDPAASTVIRFSGVEGGPFSAVGADEWTLSLGAPGPGGETQIDFTAADNQTWLEVAPGSGTIGGAEPLSAQVVASIVEAQAEGLSAGTYSATVSFTNTTTGLGDTDRPVELQISPASFSVAPSYVNIIAALNDASTIPPFIVSLSNNSGRDLSYKLTAPSRSWYSLSKTTGTVPASGSSTFSILVNAAGLIPGKYTVDIDVENTTNGAGSTTVPLTVLVRAAGAGAVTLTPDADVVAEGPEKHLSLPAPQQSRLANGSDRFVLWSAAADASWVSVSPLGGELAPRGEASGLDQQTVEIRMNAAVNTLPAGSHVATVTFNNLSTGVSIATRVLRVVVHPTLRIEDAADVGAVISVAPDAKQKLGSGELVFELGQLVTLTADVQDGYAFETWWLDEDDGKVDNVDDNPAVVVMNRSRVVSASIDPIGRTLTLSSSGLGTGTLTASPTGTFAENELISRYDNETNVVLTATPDAGSLFVGWAGNVPPGSSSVNPLTVVMDRDRVITARFEPEVSLVVDVAGEGAVAVDPNESSYAFGAEVTLVATPDEGWVFSSWSGDVDSTAQTLRITLEGPTVVEALFVPDDGGSGNDSVELTVEIDGDGVVAPTGGTYAKGDVVTLVATPDVGWLFTRWEGAADGTQPAVEIVMDENRTVRAVFEEDTTADRPATPTVPSPCGVAGMMGLSFCLAGLVGMRRSGVAKGTRRGSRGIGEPIE
ncbi:MAG: hypothetical protein J5J06_11135 [Phycisphaerae bacterium]|nr:hypothetical protein [Phycisphaerae bacterium]